MSAKGERRRTGRHGMATGTPVWVWGMGNGGSLQGMAWRHGGLPSGAAGDRAARAPGAHECVRGADPWRCTPSTHRPNRTRALMAPLCAPPRTPPPGGTTPWVPTPLSPRTLVIPHPCGPPPRTPIGGTTPCRPAPLLPHTTVRPTLHAATRWDDDVVFKNQARGEPKAQKRFVNDTIRNDFHKRFLQRYIR